VVYCDLKGSTSLAEQLDTESLWEVLRVYFDAMKEVLERHGGTVEKYIGDAIMAVFGHSGRHEDDALRAVRAASQMRDTLAEVNVMLLSDWGITLENRTGVNTGEVVSGSPTTGQRLTTGDTVNVAARLEQAAPTGEVLISESTYRLVKHAVVAETLEPLDLKGKSEPVPAHRLISVTGTEAIQRRTDTPMIGRAAELELLRRSYGLAMERRECRLVTLLADAGVGKTRLVTQFGGGLPGTATVIVGRCLSYGTGIAFWPLAEAFRQAAGIDQHDSEERARSKLAALAGSEYPGAADRLGSVMGLSSVIYSLDEIMWSARVVFEETARRRPLVIVFEDIHWAEPTFLDLVEHVVDRSHDAGFLVVCVARKDLLEQRPSWMENRKHASRIELTELSGAETALVVRHLLGDAELPDDALEQRILDAAAGNPLFVEQMLAMLVEDGHLIQAPDGAWRCTISPAEIDVPPSISSLLASRLDRLTDDERSVLHRGSVIGHVFYPSAVAALGEDDGVDDVRDALGTLAHKQLICPAESIFAGEPCWTFVHILVRDAAYREMLKRQRAKFHERFANWLWGISHDRPAEFGEIVGYHLEQAVTCLADLGILDQHGQAMAVSAAGHLGSAGERAFARQDVRTAANLLLRAADLLDEGDRTKARLLIDGGEALAEAGDLAQSALVLDHAIEMGRALGDHALETCARLAQLYFAHSTNPQVLATDVADEAERAIADFTPTARHDVLYWAWRLLVAVNWTTDTFGPAEEALEQSARHAEADGNGARARRTLGALAICALYGPSPVPRAIARCEDLLAQATDETKSSAIARCALARLEAMRGNFDRARTLYQLSRERLEEFGWSLLAAQTSLDSGPIEMLAGQLEAAERELRGDYEALTRMGEQNYIATTAAFLAEVVYRQGRLDEAADLVDFSSRVALPHDVMTQVLWRCVRGKLLARQGRLGDSEELVAQAITLVDRTDHVDAQGDVRLHAGEVYFFTGRSEQRAQVLAEAIERFEQKGNIVSLSTARAACGQTSLIGGRRPVPDRRGDRADQQ
jgi:class 3 adenylate cyclase/tetratricopeptide (TPR) repeat protein